MTENLAAELLGGIVIGLTIVGLIVSRCELGRFRIGNLIERLVGLGFLVVFAPMCATVVWAIRFSGRRRVFNFIDMEEADGRRWRKIVFATREAGSSDDDRLGHHLRRLNLHQLPFFLNVAKGDTHLPRLGLKIRTPQQRAAELCGAINVDEYRDYLLTDAKCLLGMKPGHEYVGHEKVIMVRSTYFMQRAKGPEGYRDYFRRLGSTPELADKWERAIGPTEGEIVEAENLLPVFRRMWSEALHQVRGSRATHDATRARMQNERTFRARSSRRVGPRARQRSGACSNTRTPGSRRVTSRSAGGGSSGDDPGGEPEPAPSRWSTPLTPEHLLVENVDGHEGIDKREVRRSHAGWGADRRALTPLKGESRDAPVLIMSWAMVIRSASCRYEKPTDSGCGVLAPLGAEATRPYGRTA